MEFLEGVTLKHRICGKPMETGEFCRSALKLRTHSTRRTRKASSTVTSNLRTSLSPSAGNAKILDFGLAKLQATAGTDDGATLTQEAQLELAGCGDWHALVHVTGAGPGRGAGCTHGFVFVRRGALRDGDRGLPFRGRVPVITKGF